MNNEQIQWTPPPAPKNFLVDKKEFVLAGCVFIGALLIVNSLFYGGLNLAFGVFAVALVVTISGFLIAGKKRLGGYSTTLLVFSVLIALGFIRSDDAFVKFVLFVFLVLSVNMAWTVSAGRNKDGGRGLRSVGMALLLPIAYGFGGMPQSLGGLFGALRKDGGKGKYVGAVLGGLAIAIPVLVLLVPLLIKADAAFDGLMGLLPEIEFGEIFLTGFFGIILFILLFSYTMSLVHEKEQTSAQTSTFKGINTITVSTVLILVGFVYVLYLVSQLAYIFGGMSGILPEDFTLAEYARRGFFEMALLCLVNLAIMVGSIGLVRKEKGIPGLCRWLCVFVGLISLLFVVSSATKMGLYIQGYGLTRLRVLTLVITLFLGLCALTVMLWLFLPKLPYMKVILITALILGTVVLWVDVDTVVAYYNVQAYLDGKLEFVDVKYLSELSDGAIPMIQRLTQVEAESIAQRAKEVLQNKDSTYADIRGFNFAAWYAKRYCPKLK